MNNQYAGRDFFESGEGTGFDTRKTPTRSKKRKGNHKKFAHVISGERDKPLGASKGLHNVGQTKHSA